MSGLFHVGICFVFLTFYFRVFSQHPTVNDELPNRILSGTVQVKPNIRRFQGSSVEFDDGSVVEDVDLVVGLELHTFLHLHRDQ